MQITKQLAIFLENEPGMLARVCHALADAKVNIYAISASDTVDHTVIRMVVDNPKKALFVFEERGTLVVEDDVLMIDGERHDGHEREEFTCVTVPVDFIATVSDEAAAAEVAA